MPTQNPKRAVEQLTTREIVLRGLVGLLNGLGDVSPVEDCSFYNVYVRIAGFGSSSFSFGYEPRDPLRNPNDIDSLRLEPTNKFEKINDKALGPLRERIQRTFPDSKFLDGDRGNMHEGRRWHYEWLLPMARVAAYSIEKFGYRK